MGDSIGDNDDEPPLPSLLSYISTTRFWYKALRWPVLLLLANIVVIILLDAFNEDSADLRVLILRSDNDYTRRDQWSRLDLERMIDPVALRFRIMVTFSVVIMLAAVNALLLRGAIRVVEKELRDDCELEEEVPSPIHIYAKASNRIDQFLSQGRSIHKINFTVNLLYILFVLMMTMSAMWLSSLVCVAIMNSDGKDESTTMPKPKIINESSPSKNLDGVVPQDLQDWARGGRQRDLSPPESVSFIHLTNGCTFFIGFDPAYDSPDSHRRSARTLLFSTLPTGELKAYPNVPNPIQLQRFETKNNAADDFCCLYRDDDNHSEEWHQSQASVFCRYHGNFNNYSWPAFTDDVGKVDMIPRDNIVWLRSQRYHGKQRVAIEKLDMETMNSTSVIQAVADEVVEDQREDENDRYELMGWIAVLVGTISSVASATWLFKVKELPCCSVPLVVTIQVLAAPPYSETDLAMTISFLGPMVLTVGRLLMNPHLAKAYSEMLVWALYSLLLWGFVMTSDGFQGPSEKILMLALASIVIGLLLKHPILQLAAWVGAFTSVLVTIVALYNGDTQALLYFVPMSIVVSCGLAALGYHVDKYRVRIAVYTRRLWRAMEEVEARTTRNRNNNNDQDNPERANNQEVAKLI